MATHHVHRSSEMNGFAALDPLRAGLFNTLLSMEENGLV
jgi:hypothetical protein